MAPTKCAQPANNLFCFSLNCSKWSDFISENIFRCIRKFPKMENLCTNIVYIIDRLATVWTSCSLIFRLHIIRFIVMRLKNLIWYLVFSVECAIFIFKLWAMLVRWYDRCIATVLCCTKFFYEQWTIYHWANHQI